MEGELFRSVDPGMAFFALVALLIALSNYLKLDAATTDKLADEVVNKDIVQWVAMSFKSLAELISQCAIATSAVSLFCAIIGKVNWAFVLLSFAGSILVSVSMRRLYLRVIENAQLLKIIIK